MTDDKPWHAEMMWWGEWRVYSEASNGSGGINGVPATLVADELDKHTAEMMAKAHNESINPEGASRLPLPMWSDATVYPTHEAPRTAGGSIVAALTEFSDDLEAGDISDHSFTRMRRGDKGNLQKWDQNSLTWDDVLMGNE